MFILWVSANMGNWTDQRSQIFAKNIAPPRGEYNWLNTATIIWLYYKVPGSAYGIKHLFFDRTALPTEQFRSLSFCCCGSVDLELAAWQPSWPRAESQRFQALTEDVHFYQILTTKLTKRIRDFFEYALY